MTIKDFKSEKIINLRADDAYGIAYEYLVWSQEVLSSVGDRVGAQRIDRFLENDFPDPSELREIGEEKAKSLPLEKK